MTERRYGEDEVAAIFRYATEEQKTRDVTVPGSEGLTLAQIQEVGRDVGIGPDAIARAAAVLDHPQGTSVRRFLGFPIRVGRTVELGREVSEAEWQRLVVDLDEIFNAQGVVEARAGFRSWRNGNLRVTIEPGPSGSRLRLGTYHEAAHRVMGIGIAMWGIFAAASGLTALGYLHWHAASLGAAALILFGVSAVRLPWWARRRLRQMDEVAQKLLGPSSTTS